MRGPMDSVFREENKDFEIRNSSARCGTCGEWFIGYWGKTVCFPCTEQKEYEDSKDFRLHLLRQHAQERSR